MEMIRTTSWRRYFAKPCMMARETGVASPAGNVQRGLYHFVRDRELHTVRCQEVEHVDGAIIGCSHAASSEVSPLESGVFGAATKKLNACRHRSGGKNFVWEQEMGYDF